MRNAVHKVMPPANAPCLNCKDRFVKDGHTCHESCEKYLAFREARAQLNKEITEAAIKEKTVEIVQKRGYQKRQGKKVTVR